MRNDHFCHRRVHQQGGGTGGPKPSQYSDPSRFCRSVTPGLQKERLERTENPFSPLLDRRWRFAEWSLAGSTLSGLRFVAYIMLHPAPDRNSAFNTVNSLSYKRKLGKKTADKVCPIQRCAQNRSLQGSVSLTAQCRDQAVLRSPASLSFKRAISIGPSENSRRSERLVRSRR